MKHLLYPQRDPIKNYFPLPNDLFHLGLRFGEIAVYAYLMYRENRKDYTCVVSYREIGTAGTRWPGICLLRRGRGKKQDKRRGHK